VKRARILALLLVTALVVAGAVAAAEVTVSSPSVGAYINLGDPDPYPVTADVTGEATGVEFLHCDDASVDCSGGTWVVFGNDDSAPYVAPLPLDPEGNRALKARATDSGGTFESPVVNVVIDRTVPLGGLTAPADGVFVAGPETVTANPSDGVSGVASVEFQRSPGGAGDWTTIATRNAAPWSAPWATTSVADGDIDLRVVKTDVAGNSAASTVRTVTVDNTPPSGVSLSYPDGYDPNGSITVGVANGTDGGSGVAPASAQLDRRSANLVDGACAAFGAWAEVPNPNTVASGDCAQYRYSVADALGNRAEATSTNVVKVDLTPPAPAAVDLVESEPDEHAPGTTLFYNPAIGNGGSFTVGVTSTDPESGVGSVAFPDVFGGDGATDSAGPYSHGYSWTLGATEAGSKTVTVRNDAGLLRNATFTVTPDTTGPAGGSISYVNGYNTSGSIPVTTAPGADGGSGLDAASESLERRTTTLSGGACGTFAGAWTEASSPNTVSSGSCVEYRFTARDNVGNATTYDGAAVTRVDTSPPAVVNLAPVATAGAGRQYFDAGDDTLYFRPVGTGSFTLRANVTDPESGDDRVTFPNFDAQAGWTAAGGVDVTGPNPYVSPVYTWTGAAASPGARVVRGRNNALLTANTSITITADAADPTGGSVTYANGFDDDGVVAVTGTAGTDALSGIDPSTAVLERGLSNLAGGTCPAPASWTTVASSPDAVPNGQCARYRYRVSDRVGNEAIYTSPNVVRVDTAAPSAPTLTLSESSPFAAVSGAEIFVNSARPGSFDVSAATSDPDSGVAKVRFPERPDVLSPPFEATYALDDLPAGGQTVTAFDDAGNTASSSFTVTRDAQPPSGGSIDYPDGYQTTTGVTVTTTDAGDDVSGVASAVLERQTSTLANGVCAPLSGAWAEAPRSDTVASGRCARYRFRVADRVGNEVVYVSPNLVKVDTTAPAAPALALFEDEPDEHPVGRTLYYRPSGDGGSFTVEASASDSQSGIEKVSFPSLLGDGGGDDTEDPYEHTYSFASGTTDSATGSVVAHNGAGVSTPNSIAVKPDGDPPTGGGISYPGGYIKSGLVTITTSSGTDALSRIDPEAAAVERQVALLSGGVCGAFGAWNVTANPETDTLAPNTCARYRLRISDHVGNGVIYTSANVARFDNSPPAPVTGAAATAGDHVVTLRWTRPTDGDFEAVRIVRKRSGASPVQVYLGAGAGFRDTSVTNGVRYIYELRTRDGSGNQSSLVSVAATPRNPYLVSPRDGAVVSRPPLLDWRRKTGATYYNVQLWRRGVKILSFHPGLSQYQLRSSWRYNGRVYRLTAGRYRWLVWPGFRQPAAATFGKLLGWSEFTKQS
jgi:hypothetical protein